MDMLFDSLSAAARERLQKAGQPDWVEPMLATLTHDYFSDKDWIYERKLDGERCLVYRDGDDLRLMSRNRHKLNARYPELEAALRALDPQQYIVDGEIVAFEGDVTSFSRLQQRMQIRTRAGAAASDVAVFYYIFDLLYLECYDTSPLALRDRKLLLQNGIAFADPLRYEEHRDEKGEEYFAEACRRGWEGIIAKDATSPYEHGRSRKWLKFKCVADQEFVIGGYTDPHGRRSGFGALLLGYYDGDRLRYAGKVGTGFDDETLQRLHKKLQAIERQSAPFVADADLPSTEVHWVAPDLVAEIGFEEWTAADRLRQPRYQGLRDDKDPRQVVREDTGV